MAKKSSIENNLKKQRIVSSSKARRSALKAVVMNQTLPIEERFQATLKLASLPRNGAENRVINRCLITGRPRAYYRKMQMSRIALRELGNKGLIPGLVKSSW